MSKKIVMDKNAPNISRDIGIDIVKALAISFVIGVHFFLNTKFYTTSLNNCNLFFQTLLQQIFLSCIPLFLMATGYLNNNTNISFNYFKKIIPIIIIYLIYSIPALIYRYSIGEIGYDIKLWIEQILTFKGHRYSWYINLYFGLFLLIPFFNKMYFSLNSKKEKLTLIIILLFLTTIANVPNYWAKLYPLAYFYIGKFIKEFKPNINIYKCIIYFTIIVLLETSIEFIVASGGKYIHYFNDYSSIFRALQSIIIFIICYNIKINNRYIESIIVKISSSTLDIYLASFFADRILYKPLKALFLTQDKMFIYLPIMVLSVLILSYIIAYCRIKFLKVENLVKNKKSNILKVKEQVA